MKFWPFRSKERSGNWAQVAEEIAYGDFKEEPAKTIDVDVKSFRAIYELLTLWNVNHPDSGESPLFELAEILGTSFDRREQATVQIKLKKSHLIALTKLNLTLASVIDRDKAENLYRFSRDHDNQLRLAFEEFRRAGSKVFEPTI